MAHSIGTLTDEGRRALCSASIIGSSIRLGMLVEPLDRDAVALRRDLQGVHEWGLLVVFESGLAPERGDEALPMGDERYEFVHDRVPD